MSDFFTRTGDDGYTGLLGSGRVPKNHPRMEAVGAVDEATASIGVLRAASQAAHIPEMLVTVQRDLYGLMAELAATPENAERFRAISAERVVWLEEQTSALSKRVVVPKEFILPGDSSAGAAAAVARTTVRRAERRTAELLHSGESQNPELLRYLNRLSSLLFVVELAENEVAGQASPSLAKGKPTP